LQVSAAALCFVSSFKGIIANLPFEFRLSGSVSYHDILAAWRAYDMRLGAAVSARVVV
jgi:hypothetical protein